MKINGEVLMKYAPYFLTESESQVLILNKIMPKQNTKTRVVKSLTITLFTYIYDAY